LNRRNTVIDGVDLAFDAEGNLIAFWRVNVSPGLTPRLLAYTVATKAANGPRGRHGRADQVGPHTRRDFVLSVAPSGRAVIGWWHRQPGSGIQFRVRVRAAADLPWRSVRALSSYRLGGRNVSGDVAINDDGTATAAWKMARLVRGRPWVEVQRSMLTESGVWTAPVTMTGPRSRALRRVVWQIPVQVAASPDGFTAITWTIRRLGQDTWWQTVVVQRTADGAWTRNVLPGAHDSLAVGAQGTMAVVKRLLWLYGIGGIRDEGLEVTWRSNRSGWTTTTLAPRQIAVATLEPAVHIDAAGRVFVPWSELSQVPPSFMSTHAAAWTTTTLWSGTTNTRFAAADVSPNGRAVAIRTATDAGANTTAVQMRVLSPG
jgi:hypothetical protein